MNIIFVCCMLFCSLNTHALVASHLRDELINCSNICAANHEDYLQSLPETDQNIIDKLRKRSTKGEEPWYPLTVGDILLFYYLM